jgi:geranylgeranyl pyrophosphate synthase
MEDLAAVRGVVNSLLRQYVESAAVEAFELDDVLGEFWHNVGEVIQAGGKRLRPYLVVLAYEACGGHDRWSILPVAAAWEMLHQSLLVHDDIIDHDYSRHGVANVGGIYQKRYQQTEAANSVALLAGDLMQAVAQQLILNSEVPMVMKPDLLRLLSYAYQVTGYGELLEIESLFQPPDIAQPTKIAELKTAHYSFNGPLQSGALLAGASSEVLMSMAQLGKMLGIAYQYTDDLLGVFGDEAITGKSSLSDLREGKRTRLLQLTYQQLSSVEKRDVDYVLGTSAVTDQQLRHVAELMRKYGVGLLQVEINDLIERAEAVITALPIASKAQRRFMNLLPLLVNRQA